MNIQFRLRVVLLVLLGIQVSSFFSLASESTAAVSGQVLNGKIGIPHSRIELLLPASETVVQRTFTDADGLYSLKNVPFGNWMLRVSSRDKISHEYELSVNQEVVQVSPIILPSDAKSTPIEIGTNTSVSLEPIVNFKVDHVRNARLGDVNYGGVEFHYTGSAFRTQDAHGPDRPVQGIVNLNIAQPRVINLLVNAGTMLSTPDLRPLFIGEEIGNIKLWFSNGESYTVHLKAWENIRETWQYNDQRLLIPPSQQPGVKLSEAYTEPQTRAGREATATIDMLTIDIPQEFWRQELNTIEINDTSQDTVKNIAPSIIVMGVSVRSHTRKLPHSSFYPLPAP